MIHKNLVLGFLVALAATANARAEGGTYTLTGPIAGDCDTGMSASVYEASTGVTYDFFVPKPCAVINFSRSSEEQALQVAEFAGLKSDRNYILLSHSGDCRGTTFRLYDRARAETFDVSVGDNVCASINFYENLDFGRLADAVVGYFGWDGFHDYSLISDSANGCDPRTFGIQDNVTGETAVVTIRKPCDDVNFGRTLPEQAKRVAELVGFNDLSRRYLLANYIGDCNGMTFELYDRVEQQTLALTIGSDVCSLINFYEDHDPKATGDEVVRHFGLGQ